MKSRWTLAAVIAVAACSAQSQAPTVGEAYIRLAAVPGRPAAGYFVIRGGAKDATLVRVEASGVSRAELHGSRMTSNGMVTMDSLPDVPVSARTTVAFAPGGRHVMLFGVPATIVPGTKLPLTLQFADGQTAQVDARVIAANDVAPE